MIFFASPRNADRVPDELVPPFESSSRATGSYLLAARTREAASTAVSLDGYPVPILSVIDLSAANGAGNRVVAAGTAQARSAGAIPKAAMYTSDAGT
jgi:hypothetical protein